MSRILKSRLLCFILGAVIFGSIGVVSAYTLLANDTAFTPTDENWKKEDGTDIEDVASALDYLYENFNLSYGDAQYANAIGASNTKTGSITLNKGKYILITTDGYSAGTPSSASSQQAVSTKMVECSSGTNCIIKRLAGYNTTTRATAKENDNQYHYVVESINAYYINVLSDSTTISLTRTSGIASQYAARVPIFVKYMAIPLTR